MYKAFGYYIDYSGVVGSISSRGYNSGLDYFRPHGIFQEPNGYSTLTFCLLVLAQHLPNRNLRIEGLGIISMVMSQSLWGMVGAVILCVGTLRQLDRSSFIFLSALGVSITLAQLPTGILDLFLNVVTIERVADVTNDASFSQRVGGLFNLTGDSLTNYVLGSGVDSSAFQGQLGANGFSFLVTSFGLLFSVPLFLIVCSSLQFRMSTILPLLFLMTTYPPFSYMYFWAWLALLVFLVRQKRWRSAGPVVRSVN